MKVINTEVQSLPKFGVRDDVNLMAVLVETSDGLLAVYLAHVSIIRFDDLEPCIMSDSSKALNVAAQIEKAKQFTMSSGWKQSYSQALAYFPTLKADEYRR
jgi:hypothetical protein